MGVLQLLLVLELLLVLVLMMQAMVMVLRLWAAEIVAGFIVIV